MKWTKIIPLFLTVSFLCACSTEIPKEIVPQINKSQIQQQWRLVAIDEQPIAIGINSTLTISGDDKATGELACNYFFGSLTLQGTKLRLENMGSTRKSCRGKAGDVERIVSTILNNWSKVLLDNNRLILIGKSHRLHYKR